MADTKKLPMIRCANCGTTFDRTLVSSMPFCSERCRSIDLGNWLDESYGLPCEGEGVPDRVEIEDDNSESY